MPGKNDPLKVINKLIGEAATRYKTQPYDVTSAQFWSVAGDKISEWEIRKLGGFTAIRSIAFPAPPRDPSRVFTPQGTAKLPRYKPQRLENFTVHDTDLAALFRQAKLKKDDVLRIIVQPDTHVPEFDEAAVDAFIKFVKYYQPHGIINLGDFLEMESVSHWPARCAAPRRLVPEIKAAREILQRIDQAAGPQCVYKRFILGNHEKWLDDMLVARIPEIYDGLSELGVDLRLEGLLGLKDFGYRVIPLNEILQLGNLCFIHGYFTGKHHASKHLDTFGTNLIYGHVHDTQSYSGVSVRGVYEAQSIGCLRTLNAGFLRGKPNNWTHAFGIVEMRLDGNFTKYVPIIINGEFTFNGKKFKGTSQSNSKSG